MNGEIIMSVLAIGFFLGKGLGALIIMAFLISFFNSLFSAK